MTNLPDFRLNGTVTNAADGEGIPNLRIEAWDKDLVFNDLLGCTTTDDRGEFSLIFSEASFREIFLDRYPDVFFRVFHDGRLLLDTSRQLICNLKPGTQTVSISVDYPVDAPPDGEGRLTGALIDPEVSFQFRRSLAQALAGSGSKYPAGAIRALRLPFDGVPDLLDMASGALEGDPWQMHRFRETLWSFGGKLVPTRIGIKIFRLHDGNRYIGQTGKIERSVTLDPADERRKKPRFIDRYDEATQLVDLNRLERVMAAAAYSARDVGELATLAGSVELALGGIDALNTLFRLVLEGAIPADIASAFDTAIRVFSFSYRPPFEGFTPSDGGFDLPGFQPGMGAPWYEWPLPSPGDPIPGGTGVPVPRIPDFEPGLVEHFEECFVFSIIPELHRIGIGFRELIYGVGTNYIIESVSPDHACPGATITLEGVRFDGALEVRYRDNRGGTISTRPETLTSNQITFTLAENAVSGPVWLYIPRTVRLCLNTYVVALPGIRGELIVGQPHIVSFALDGGACLPIGETARLRWRVSPPDVEVSIIHSHGGIETSLGSGLGAVDTLRYAPTSEGRHSFRLEASNPAAEGSCGSSSETVTLDVREPSPPPFEIVGVEMTQAIQYYDLDDPTAPTNNSLELIANMDTVLRVYVRALTSASTRVTGTVELNGITYTPINDLLGIASPIIEAETAPLRSEINHSLNFLIPAADASGRENRAMIRLISATNPCSNPVVSREQRIDWVHKSAFPITIRIVANSDGTQMSLADTVTFVNNMLFKLPTPKTAIVFHPGVFQIHRGTTEDNYCNDGGYYQLALSIAYEHNDNEGYPPTAHSSSWLGLVTPIDCTPDGMMAWPSTSTCLSIQNITVAAHEVMHTAGLGHTITNRGEGCWDGPALTGGADTQPVPCHRLEGRPTGALDEVPFDILNNRLVNNAFDLMSYRGRNNRWLSPELWVLGRTMMDTRY